MGSLVSLGFQVGEEADNLNGFAEAWGRQFNQASTTIWEETRTHLVGQNATEIVVV
jgi:hypothetical protein